MISAAHWPTGDLDVSGEIEIPLFQPTRKGFSRFAGGSSAVEARSRFVAKVGDSPQFNTLLDDGRFLVEDPVTIRPLTPDFLLRLSAIQLAKDLFSSL